MLKTLKNKNLTEVLILLDIGNILNNMMMTISIAKIRKEVFYILVILQINQKLKKVYVFPQAKKCFHKTIYQNLNHKNKYKTHLKI